MNYAIQTKNLTKKYKKYMAVDNLSINVPEGKIYGFLGKNGAGKTTTIRMIMGLIKPDNGEVLIFGKEVNQNRLFAARNIGSIVESPGFYENLTARDNLAISCEMYNVDKKRIHEVLETVDLIDIKNKKAKEFSLGMKQRLGIANALIHSPKILVLDEPVNGLDPSGIKDTRLFLKKLSQEQGITILISSHILSEVQLMADYVGIIDRGVLIKETDIKLLGSTQQDHLVLEVSNFEMATKILNDINVKYTMDNDVLKVYCDRTQNAMINRRLINNEIDVFNLSSVPLSLEEMFISITDENNPDRKAVI